MSGTNRHFSRRVGIAAVCITLIACGGKAAPGSDSAAANGSIAPADNATTMVRGTVASVSATTIAVTTDSGTTQVQLTQPVQVYDRQPARLEDVTPNTFIGVTTVKTADGTEQAKEIHIFPNELRGLGEGSRPMASAGSNGGPASRMTNGAAGAPTDKSTGSVGTMSNGTASSVGSTLVVQYAGGSMTATVPANTPVMKIAATSKPLAAGDRVVVVATKGADGSLSSNRVMLAR
jgi:hypothetical protein